MVTAISRYGPRVIPNTIQIIEEEDLAENAAKIGAYMASHALIPDKGSHCNVLERNLLPRLWRCHPRVFKGLELNVTAKSHISAYEAHPGQD